MAKAAVIGGGVSGLGAALVLSRLGHQVVVLEKMPRPASLVRGFTRKGLRYETGFHYAGGLSEGAVLHRYLERLGLFNEGLLIRPLPDPGGEFLRFIESGQDFALPRTLDDFKRLFPSRAFIFFDRCREVFSRSPYLNPEITRFDPLTMYGQGQTLAEALAGLDLSPWQGALLGFRCLLYGVKPSEAYFDQFALVNAPYLNGSHSFFRGGEGLAASFESALGAAGVKILCGREVLKIKTDEKNTAVALECQDASATREEIPFDLCVYSGSPAALPSLLPQTAFRPVLHRRLQRLKYTPAAFLLFGRTRSDFLEQRQMFISPDNLEDWFDPAQKAVYVSGGPGRGGYWPLSAVALMPPGASDRWRGGKRDQAYYDWKGQLADQLRGRLLKNLPELKGDLEIVDSATDLSLERYSHAFGPGLYGKSHSLNEAPILPLTRVGHLALAGQNIVMPGLLGALVSSALAVGSLLKHETVLEFLQ